MAVCLLFIPFHVEMFIEIILLLSLYCILGVKGEKTYYFIIGLWIKMDIIQTKWRVSQGLELWA